MNLAMTAALMHMPEHPPTNPAWIRARLKARGATQNDLAASIGRDGAAVSRLLSGAREASAAEALAMAHFLRCDVVELLAALGIRQAAFTLSVPVAGFIFADGLISSNPTTAHELGHAGVAIVNRYSGPHTITAPPSCIGGAAFVVLSNASLPQYEVGDLVLCGPAVATAPELDRLVGRECVLTMPDGERLLRRLRAGTATGLYTIVSRAGDVRINTPLAGAAPIHWIRPLAP